MEIIRMFSFLFVSDIRTQEKGRSVCMTWSEEDEKYSQYYCFKIERYVTRGTRSAQKKDLEHRSYMLSGNNWGKRRWCQNVPLSLQLELISLTLCCWFFFFFKLVQCIKPRVCYCHMKLSAVELKVHYFPLTSGEAELWIVLMYSKWVNARL